MHFLCPSISMCARWPSLKSCGSAVQRCWSFTAVVVALVTCWVSTVLRLCIAGMIWCHRCLAINGHRWGQRNVKKWRVRWVLFGSWIEIMRILEWRWNYALVTCFDARSKKVWCGDVWETFAGLCLLPTKGSIQRTPSGQHTIWTTVLLCHVVL